MKGVQSRGTLFTLVAKNQANRKRQSPTTTEKHNKTCHEGSALKVPVPLNYIPVYRQRFSHIDLWGTFKIQIRV